MASPAAFVVSESASGEFGPAVTTKLTTAPWTATPSVTFAVTVCEVRPGFSSISGVATTTASTRTFSASTASRSKPGSSPLTWVMRTATA